MWKWLHPYAKSENAHRLCGKFIPFFMVLTLLLLGVGVVWGLAYAPADYQQGNSFRIMYTCADGDLVYEYLCVHGNRRYYRAGVANPPSAFIHSCYGAYWYGVYVPCIGHRCRLGKTNVGNLVGLGCTRLTSSLILFSLYLGVIALYSAFQDRATGMKAAAILSIVGVINIPIIHFSVEWWNTLHQGASITKFENFHCDANANSVDFMHFRLYGVNDLVYVSALSRGAAMR